MITAVAFCPQAPALVPEIGRGLDAELGPVRAACRTAIRRVTAGADRIVVVADGDATAGYGVDVDVDAPTVGEWLVRDAVGRGTIHLRSDELAAADLHGTGSVALVVLGDGSARRTEKAPGHLDPRAADYDGRVAEALERGFIDYLDWHQLFHTDAEAEELLVSGADVWNAIALLAPTYTPVDADLLYADAPFGVGYFVATWQLRGVPVA